MFEGIKLEKRRRQLEKIKEEIIKEKKELEKIKEILEEKEEKIDISKVQVFTYGKISYLVNLEKKDNFFYLTDIFSQIIIFKFEFSDIKSNRKIYMGLNEEFNGENNYAYLTPIIEMIPDLLLYSDRMVPSYVLRQQLWRMNGIKISNNSIRR